MKITILALHLGVGGVEKAIATLANMLSSIHEVEIISVYKLSDKPSFDINKKIKIKYLIEDLAPNKKEFKNAVKRLNILKVFKEGIKSLKIMSLKKERMIKSIKEINSDIVISTRMYLNDLLGKYGGDYKKVAWEHFHPNEDMKHINGVVSSCKNMDYLVTVSEDLKKLYEDKVDIKCLKMPLSLDYMPSVKTSFDDMNIISVGRLSKEKGFSDLIDVMSLVKEKNDKIHLHIIGDGDERERLKEKIKYLNLVNHVTLHGFKDRKEVDIFLSKSSLYIMPSFNESFGLTVLEALSVGVPVVAFDTAKGPLEILNEKNSVIIKNRDKEKMALLIVKLISDKEKLKNMSRYAIERAECFDYDTVQKEWLTFLGGITNDKG